MKELLENIQRLVIPLTFRCNFKCQYCNVSKKAQKEFDVKTLDKILELFFKYNHCKDRSIHFFGGEPLLRYDLLVKIAKKVKQLRKKYKKKIYLGLTTNGSLLTEEKLRFLVENFPFFCVSIDSFAKDYKFRKTEALNKKLPLLLKYKDFINIKMTIMPEYADSFFYCYKQLVSLGFRNINVQPAMGFYWEKNKVDQYLNNLSKVLKLIKYLKAKGAKISFKLIDDVRRVMEKKNKSCSIIMDELSIDPDGDIYPCEFFVGLPPALKKKYIIANILSGKVNKVLIKKLLDFKMCEKGIINVAVNKFVCGQCDEDRSCHKICYGFDLSSGKFSAELFANAAFMEKQIINLVKKYI
ncbi:MAG: radical SAM protein [Candidatus Parcubacteria bacterium]|nr:radical SAM protein [Candidatus Parcubacteria bacterium]